MQEENILFTHVDQFKIILFKRKEKKGIIIGIIIFFFVEIIHSFLY